MAMPKPIDDGGPAFPRAGTWDSEFRNIQGTQRGMSLRDWMAIQIRSQLGMINTNPDELAKLCYTHADAMLRQRRVYNS